MCYQCVDTVIVLCYQCADTVVMMCYQCAALHDMVGDHEHSHLCLTDFTQVVQRVEARMQCLANKMQTLSTYTV